MGTIGIQHEGTRAIPLRVRGPAGGKGDVPTRLGERGGPLGEGGESEMSAQPEGEKPRLHAVGPDVQRSRQNASGEGARRDGKGVEHVERGRGAGTRGGARVSRAEV